MTGRARFEAELVEGHKGVTVVVVPFDPEELWSRKPARLAGRRHGWPVTGTVQGVAFEGYVGERWGRFFVIVDPALRVEAKVDVGDTVKVALAPARTKRALDLAREQSNVTTQPKKARADAV
jgi:hypothetical protein